MDSNLKSILVQPFSNSKTNSPTGTPNNGNFCHKMTSKFWWHYYSLLLLSTRKVLQNHQKNDFLVILILFSFLAFYAIIWANTRWGKAMRRTKLNNYYLEMEEHYLHLPYYDEERRIRVLLPKDYNKEDWASYPVLHAWRTKHLL